MARVVLTDGESRAALATVRALGRAGHEVCVTAARLPCLASSSRFAERSVLLPNVVSDPSGALEQLAELVGEWRADVLIPVTDAAMGTVLSQAGQHLGSTVVAGPEFRAYEALTDKAALLARAAWLGCPLPRTVVVERASDLVRAAAEVGFPCVLRPHRSAVLNGCQILRFGVRHVSSCAALGDSYPEEAYPILVQERIIGPGEGMFLLTERGQRVTAFAHRRLREKPPSGGVSTYRESIPVPPDLLAVGERLLADVGWHGVAMIEFKRCARTGQAHLLEVNGRLWGSLQLAIDAGVDFPSLLVRVALGQRVAAVRPYRVGTRTRWFWGDVDHLLARLRRSSESLNLDPGAPSVARTLWDFLHVWRPDERMEVWDSADPRPFFRETLDWIRGRGT